MPCHSKNNITMREVFVDQDHARVGYYKSVLDEAGIQSYIRNEYGNNITDIPSPLFFPTLCVVNDNDYETAMGILRDIYYAPTSQLPDWKCPKCAEWIPGSFDSCWACGELRAEAKINSNGDGNT